MDRITPVKVACRAEQDPTNLFWAGLSLFGLSVRSHSWVIFGSGWLQLVCYSLSLITLAESQTFILTLIAVKGDFFSFFPSFSLCSGEDLFHTNYKIIIARLQILYKLTKTILYIDP